jgi:Mg2+ and Co2+ transporter CorA
MPSSRQDATALAWIHVPTPDHVTLERVRTEIGLPSELITYCLLAQRCPKILPCGAWLYSTWQVPLTTGAPSSGAAGCSFRLEEIKACIRPQAFVSVYRTRRRRAAVQLDDFLPARDTAAQSASGRMLVALAERIAEGYLSLDEELSDALLEAHRHPVTRIRYARLGARVRLGRHLSDHAQAVEQLRARGARWLDASAHERLEDLARRLVGFDALTAPEAADPEAS